MRRIGVVGAGAMGGAIVAGLCESGEFLADQLVVCEADSARAANLHKQLQVRVETDIARLDDCEVVIVAVKPKATRAVAESLRPLSLAAVVSVAAGVTLQQLGNWTGKPVVRVMPNTPCLIRKGMSAIAFGPDVSPWVADTTVAVFRSLGKVEIVAEEAFDAVTALSGCGPAYVYLMMEALIDAGCSQGLSRDIAKNLVVQTFAGAAEMVGGYAGHSAELKDKVTSPGGVTIQALKVLEQGALRGILWDAVDQAAARSAAMSSDGGGISSV